MVWSQTNINFIWIFKIDLLLSFPSRIVEIHYKFYSGKNINQKYIKNGQQGSNNMFDRYEVSFTNHHNFNNAV